MASPSGPVHHPPARLTWRTSLFMPLLLAAAACTPATPTGPPPQSFGTTVFAAVAARFPNEAIDVVLVADDDYGDMNDVTARQAFLDQVAALIQSGFEMNQAWSLNADEVNYWYSTLSGDVQPGSGICPSVTWPDLSDANFAEVIVLLHPNPLRDCAFGNRVTSEPTSFNTIVHEASHAVFGLPDEYCCDGGYWGAAPALYLTEAACLGDSVNASWQQCQSIVSVSGLTWWRSEDGACDLMACGLSVVQEYGPADWTIVERILSALPNASVTPPSVFAPAGWP